MPTEDDFLEALFNRLPIPPAELVIPPGDDCAGLRVGRGRILLVAIDQIVGGRHYRLEGPGAPKPEEIGRKLLARNLSDIAAMGGRPLYCLVASAFSPRRGEAWLQRFLDGIVTLARAFGVFMIGGDLAVTPSDDTASLVILGEAPEKKVVRRSGARPGDVLISTGCFGRSVATGHHLRFVPRCREGEWLASKGYARAMIDVSDGLLLDARRLCRSSGTGLRLNTNCIPLRDDAASLREALTDGEDYELLFAAAKRKTGRLLTEWPFRETPLTIIGEFFASDRPVIRDWKGNLLDFEGAGGFDHFASPGDGGEGEGEGAS